MNFTWAPRAIRMSTRDSLGNSKFTKVYILPTFWEKSISEVVRIGGMIIFHLSKLWKATFFILRDVIFLVRLQGKFEVDHSWKWKGQRQTLLVQMRVTSPRWSCGMWRVGLLGWTPAHHGRMRSATPQFLHTRKGGLRSRQVSWLFLLNTGKSKYDAWLRRFKMRYTSLREDVPIVEGGCGLWGIGPRLVMRWFQLNGPCCVFCLVFDSVHLTHSQQCILLSQDRGEKRTFSPRSAQRNNNNTTKNKTQHLIPD